ncbi:MAG: hypothetical protein U9N56_09580 [Actinomycetota bacterium]|nr:hypothetical protein [Actinomycetota bacterium]
MFDDIAVFVTDRSFTGVEGVRFESPADAEAGEGVPAKLAAHLYASEEGLRHIYVASNTVTVGSVLAWSDTHLAAVQRAIEEFFLFYPAESPN